MKLMKTNCESLVITAVLIVLIALTTASSAKPMRRVLIHVPVKVRHHHHTHTVMKHVHHQVPVHYDHHDVHLIHPTETTHEYDDGDYHIMHGRTLRDGIKSHIDEDDHSSDYDNFERYLRKRSKTKQKLFNNMVIGWKGRKDFDKIASEYLASIKHQRIPDHDDYDDRYSVYDDDSKKK